MASRPPLHSQLSLFVAAVIMVACAATGMLAGVFAHTLAGRQSSTTPNGPVISGTAPGQALASATPSSTATEASETNTATNFILSITLSSRTLATGETFTVTVVATTTGAPVVGLSCVLRAPLSGPPGLFSTWPPAASTDSSGQVVWTLTTPSVAPGTYGIEVDAVGAHRYEFHRYATLQVS
ncbi:MAG TPA: hypothetical protein VH591_03230 [Ktedonobacterales bacterium]